MCSECVKEEFPNRDNICLENGSYIMNFAGCSQCKKKEPIAVENRVKDEHEDGTESVTYQHVCSSCQHVIANHDFTFDIDEEYQNYSMMCLLCGRGEDSRSIMPVDKRC
ncbi:protein Churchill-like [Lineus longissimus]|uniref:protein Churchill-like n=1 Tax=Lineus longissimus TaxID=88925 RepID=UPI00315D30EF